MHLDPETKMPPSKRALELYLKMSQEEWLPMHQPYGSSLERGKRVEKAFALIRQLLGVGENFSVRLTAGAAESAMEVLLGRYLQEPGRGHFLVGSGETAAMILGASRIEELGGRHTLVDLDQNGVITQDALIDALSSRTQLLSLSLGNGLTGVVQPLKDIDAICQERGVLLHLDVTHSMGRVPLEVEPDFLTVDGNALGAPVPCGLLLVKRGHTLANLVPGKTALHLPTLFALAECANEFESRRFFLCSEIARLRQLFESKIESATPLFSEQLRLPQISCLAFEGVMSESMAFALFHEGIHATFGGGETQHLSFLLRACGIDPTLSHSALSFSFSHDVDEEMIEEAASRINRVFSKLRGMSKELV